MLCSQFKEKKIYMFRSGTQTNKKHRHTDKILETDYFAGSLVIVMDLCSFSKESSKDGW